MKTHTIVLLAVGACIGFVGCPVLYLLATWMAPAEKHVPSIAGQQVPAERVSLDFSNRFNIYSAFRATNLVFSDCRIVGFTGEAGESGGRISSRYGFFNDWIVLEKRSGRRVYLPAQGVEYIEDADPVPK